MSCGCLFVVGPTKKSEADGTRTRNHRIDSTEGFFRLVALLLFGNLPPLYLLAGFAGVVVIELAVWNVRLLLGWILESWHFVAKIPLPPRALVLWFVLWLSVIALSGIIVAGLLWVDELRVAILSLVATAIVVGLVVGLIFWLQTPDGLQGVGLLAFFVGCLIAYSNAIVGSITIFGGLVLIGLGGIWRAINRRQDK